MDNREFWNERYRTQRWIGLLVCENRPPTVCLDQNATTTLELSRAEQVDRFRDKAVDAGYLASGRLC